ncbi:MAG: TIM-barrel domain-containing protein, partial [Phycisphaerae bacterium]
MANLFPRHRSLIFLRAILLGWFFAIGSSCIASHSATREEVDFHRRSNPACLASIGRAESLGPGVARFYARDVDPRALPASLAIEREPVVVGRPSQQWPVFPLFVRAEGRHAVRVHIEPGTDLYGTGEIAGPLRRNGQVTQAWNTDSYDYNRGSRQLYQSHPWVLAVRRDGTSFGVLADTTWRCRIDLTDGIEFSTKQRSFPVIIITGKTPQQVLIRLSRLIGTLPMPPKWALGYHQCRYSYYPDSRVREIADGFRRRHIPCDVIWLDIDYMHGFRIFTFNPTHFP